MASDDASSAPQQPPLLSRIRDIDEVIRWINENRDSTYMMIQYQEKYQQLTTPRFWDQVREVLNIQPPPLPPVPIPRNLELRHYRHPTLRKLRLATRKQLGENLPPDKLAELQDWAAMLAEAGVVVKYDPNTVEGFTYVDRRPGIDKAVFFEPDADDHNA